MAEVQDLQLSCFQERAVVTCRAPMAAGKHQLLGRHHQCLHGPQHKEEIFMVLFMTCM